jgi:hypothetical protein
MNTLLHMSKVDAKKLDITWSTVRNLLNIHTNFDVEGLISLDNNFFTTLGPMSLSCIFLLLQIVKYIFANWMLKVFYRSITYTFLYN